MDLLAGSQRRALAVVFVLAFCTLMFELMISRMSVFYLNYANAFLAIPLTLFGLAIGSLRVHLGKTPVESVDIARNLVALTAVSIFAFAAIFFMFSTFLPITHRNDPTSAATVIKMITFVVVFLPPFFYVGKILTALYATHKQIIGKLYSRDLFGAALGGAATPILFHFLDLPYLIAICLAAMTVVTAIALGRRRWKTVALFVLLVAASLPLLVALEGGYDMSRTISRSKKVTVTEIAHRWNEFSRVSLLKVEWTDKPEYWKIVHDNAESNVPLIPYQPEFADRSVDPEFRIAGWLGRKQDRIMVMFAGVGRQMIQYDAIGAGRELLVGVEINPLVLALGTKPAEVQRFRIGEFLAKPNVELHIAEGRSYLDNDPNVYDIIQVASDAATSKYKTGHSRKYLDTVEATRSYLDHVTGDGLIIFSCMPIDHRIESLKKVHSERDLGALDNHVFVGTKKNRGWPTLIYSPRPFTPDETKAFLENYSQKRSIYYTPGSQKNRNRFARLVTEDADPGYLLVTDDRPFIHPLDFNGFELIPSKQQIMRTSYYLDSQKFSCLKISSERPLP